MGPSLNHRLLFAALAGSVASLVLKTADMLNPGLPQSTVIVSKHVPFFQHMLVAGWVAVLAYFAAPALLRRRALPPKPLFAAIAVASLAAGALQWFFPNY